MKKNKLSIFFSLFLLTFTSCNSFLLQDQTSISISIDSQEINNALRSVDYSIEEPYILSRLTGNKGFFQEEQFIINDDDNFNFTLKNIPYGQTYTLQFYIVLDGSTFLYGCQENISLTKAQNVLELKITPNNIDFYVDKINIDFYPRFSQELQGSYFMKADITDSPTYYFDSFNQYPLYIELSAQIIVPDKSLVPDNDNFSPKNAYFLISHNKKSEKINCALKNEDMNVYGNTDTPIQYYFTETGNYTIKYFAFDTNNCFATKTITLYVGKNEIDTDIYLYDLVSNKSHNVYLDNSLTENTSQTNNIFNDSSTNNFDFCLDKVGNIYLTDGYSIYKNNQNNNIASTYDNSKIIKIKFDYSTNKLYAWVQSNYKNYFFEIDTAGYKSMEINPDYQFTKSFDDFVISNSLLYTISSTDITAYSFVSRPINYNNKVLAINADFVSSKKYNTIGDYVNDSILIDNKIYILRSYVETSEIFSDSPVCNSSIVIYDITKTDDNPQVISNHYSENTTISSPVFINPKKIIAIKPKELIIADEGLLFDTKKRTYRNSNRVLSFSLDGSNGNNSIKLMKILNKIKLNEEHEDPISGCGCSPYTYDPE